MYVLQTKIPIKIIATHFFQSEPAKANPQIKVNSPSVGRERNNSNKYSIVCDLIFSLIQFVATTN
jgi:hypothetical protein